MDGVLIGKIAQVLEPFGWVEVGSIEKVYLPGVSSVDSLVVLSVEPDLGLTYGAYAAGNYPLWLSVTDTGPASSVATGVIY